MGSSGINVVSTPEINTQNSTKNITRRAEERKNNISSNQHLKFTNIPTDEKNNRRNPKQQQQKNNNKQTKRIFGLVASSFILLFLFLKFHSKTTTTKNRDLESFLSQLFSQFSSMKLKQA